MILILAAKNDPHALSVAAALARRGVGARIADTGELGCSGNIVFTVGDGERREWLVGDERLDLAEVRAIWWRRYQRPRVALELARSERSFAWREWYECIVGLLSATGAPCINLPVREQQAVKPLQLAIARRLGLALPETLITNDPQRARTFVERHRGEVVHKTLTPPERGFLPTQRWHEDDDSLLMETLPLAPTIFQRVVAARREVRVTIVGAQLFAAELEPSPGEIDARLDLEAPYRPHSLPAAVANQLRALADALGLSYATVDLKLTDEGEYLFLELNPAGQFLYVEILTGLPISDAVADLLCNAPMAHALHEACRLGWSEPNQEALHDEGTNRAGVGPTEPRGA